jgi:hypothetical protein
MWRWRRGWHCQCGGRPRANSQHPRTRCISASASDTAASLATASLATASLATASLAVVINVAWLDAGLV